MTSAWVIHLAVRASVGKAAVRRQTWIKAAFFCRKFSSWFSQFRLHLEFLRGVRLQIFGFTPIPFGSRRTLRQHEWSTPEESQGEDWRREKVTVSFVVPFSLLCADSYAFFILLKIIYNRRLFKEKISYEKELEKERVKLTGMRQKAEDEYRIKKQVGGGGGNCFFRHSSAFPFGILHLFVRISSCAITIYNF